MAKGFLDRCIFTATSTGTVDFVPASAVTGYLTPAQAGAVDGVTYNYFAQSADLSQWEVGKGVYTVSGTVLDRVPIFSSNSNNLVSFSAAPKVHMGGPLAQDMHWERIFREEISSPVDSVASDPIDPTAYSALVAIGSGGLAAASGRTVFWQVVDEDDAFTGVFSVQDSAGDQFGVVAHVGPLSDVLVGFGVAQIGDGLTDESMAWSSYGSGVTGDLTFEIGAFDVEDEPVNFTSGTLEIWALRRTP